MDRDCRRCEFILQSGDKEPCVGCGPNHSKWTQRVSEARCDYCEYMTLRKDGEMPCDQCGALGVDGGFPSFSPAKLPSSPEKDRGDRHNAGKPRMSLLPPGPIIEVMRVAEYGSRKYADRNWEKGLSYSEILDCLFRHALKWMGRERMDQESNCHHLAHVVWNALALMQMEVSRPDLDDRSKLDFFVGFNRDGQAQIQETIH